MSELVHEPVSWLLLERYALGELNGEERASVELRLSASDADRACLDSIVNDESELPPLPALPRPRPRPRQNAALWLGGALSMAAALALTVLRPFDSVPNRRQVSSGIKGGEVALMLHGERTGASPGSFRDGDRFKLLVTCPSWLSTQLSVVMFQDGQRYRPLPAMSELMCGNQVPWPGAFTLDGAGDVDVCVTWSANTEARSASELDPDVVCERLIRSEK